MFFVFFPSTTHLPFSIPNHLSPSPSFLHLSFIPPSPIHLPFCVPHHLSSLLHHPQTQLSRSVRPSSFREKLHKMDLSPTSQRPHTITHTHTHICLIHTHAHTHLIHTYTSNVETEETHAGLTSLQLWSEPDPAQSFSAQTNSVVLHTDSHTHTLVHTQLLQPCVAGIFIVVGGTRHQHL